VSSPPYGTSSEFAGTDEVTWTLGGHYLAVRYTTTRENSPPRDALLLIRYDYQTTQYRMWQFASPDRDPSKWIGNFEGDRLVLMAQRDPDQNGGIGAGLQRTPEGYARISGVAPGGPAAGAGLKEGDVITQIDGIAQTSAAPAQALRTSGKVGAPVRLTVRSGGQEREVTVVRQTAPPLRLILEPASRTERHATEEVQLEGRWRKVSERIFTTSPQ
jgi:hypothetical protein